MINNDVEINDRILNMKKDNNGLLVIHKWLSKWDNFSQLDDLIILIHILNVLRENKMVVEDKEIKKCFNKFYKREFHGGKQEYLNWMYSLGVKKEGVFLNRVRAKNHSERFLTISNGKGKKK